VRLDKKNNDGGVAHEPTAGILSDQKAALPRRRSMADTIDQAKETEEQFLLHALAQRRESGPEGCGECLNCGSEIQEGRWCNTECRDEWQDEQLRMDRIESKGN
jgi:hypothetical protein